MFSAITVFSPVRQFSQLFTAAPSALLAFSHLALGLTSSLILLACNALDFKEWNYTCHLCPNRGIELTRFNCSYSGWFGQLEYNVPGLVRKFKSSMYFYVG